LKEQVVILEEEPNTILVETEKRKHAVECGEITEDEFEKWLNSTPEFRREEL